MWINNEDVIYTYTDIINEFFQCFGTLLHRKHARKMPLALVVDKGLYHLQ